MPQPPNNRPPDWPATDPLPFTGGIFQALIHLLSNFHVEGKENIPDSPFVVTSNHLSYFDVPAISPQLPRNIVGLAAQKYRGTLLEPLFHINALIWVKQFSADREALKQALYILKHGAPLAIAPEGTRSKTGGLIQGRDGTAFIVNRANVPIVPVAVWGSEKILRRPRPKVTVRIGKPYTLPEGRAKGAELNAYTERIMCAIAALLPEQYHGVYRGNPLIDEMAAIVR